MSKYAPLAVHLRESGQDALPMTFGEIESIIGAELPPSAFSYRAWWSNNPTNNVMTRAWREAGYVSADVSLASRKLVFRKAAQDARPSANDAGGPDKAEPDVAGETGVGPLSRIFGALKGMVTIKPGTDLTEPTGTEWDAAR